MQVLTFPIFKYGKWGKDSILAHNTLFVFGWMETTGQLIVPLTNPWTLIPAIQKLLNKPKK